MHRTAARRAVTGALALACACAGPPRLPAPPAVAAPRPGPEAGAARGSYGPEPSASVTPLEQAALAALLPRLASPLPRLSPSLVLAAREVARRASEGEDPRLHHGLRGALAAGLAFDPAPSMHFVAAPAESAPAALASTIAGAPAATHLGVGAITRGGQAFVAVLLARRAAALQPFPRDVAAGTTAVLRGELLGLEDPSVHVTTPAGESVQVLASSGRGFHVPLRFDTPGRWLVEVVGHGPRGPEVAALLTVSCGGAPLYVAGEPEQPEPSDLRQAEERVVAAVNATRRRHGLGPLTPSPEIAAVARRHSDAMLAAGTLAHVLPGSGSVRDRLHRARIGYRAVFENVARGATTLGAHHVIEESPAHRENVLAREASEVGCGAARGRLPNGERVAYLTEIFLQPVDDGADDRLTPDTRVRVVIWRERSRLGAPALVSDPRLDGLARDAASRMLRAGELGAGPLGDRALELGRRVAAVDTFVASSPADVARSRNLADRRFRRVGVGVAIGDSPRYGKGLLWIAVLYTD